MFDIIKFISLPYEILVGVNTNHSTLLEQNFGIDFFPEDTTAIGSCALDGKIISSVGFDYGSPNDQATALDQLAEWAQQNGYVFGRELREDHTQMKESASKFQAFAILDGKYIEGINHPYIVEEAAYNRGHFWWDDDVSPGTFGYLIKNDDGTISADIYSDFFENSQDPEQHDNAIALIKKHHPEVTHITYGPDDETREQLQAYSSYDILAGVEPNLDILNELVAKDAAAATAYELLRREGGRVYVVGGAVRDALLGKQPKDIDLMVTGLSGEQIQEALKGAGGINLTGEHFGVYRFKCKGRECEIALPRTEVSTGAGHKDFDVHAAPDIPVEEDLSRRDFTANAMAYDLDNRHLVDPFDGAADIQQGKLSLVNESAFKDDPLRIVRAIVAYARHGLMPDNKTLESMKEHAKTIRHLPPERIQAELDKLFSSDNPAEAIEIAQKTGLLEYLIPEVANAWDVDQKNGHHDLDVGRHLLQVLRHMATITPDPDLRLAALLHDIGKPDSMWVDDDGHGHFYQAIGPDGNTQGEDHQELGADMTRAYMKRMKYPNVRIDRVSDLIQKHMFPYFNTPKGARRFLQFAGDERMADDLLKLREADSRGKGSGEQNAYDANAIMAAHTLVEQEKQRQNAFSKKDLAINGSDLIQLGFKPGPAIGTILDDCLDQVVEDPKLNDKNTLLEYVRQNYANT